MNEHEDAYRTSLRNSQTTNMSDAAPIQLATTTTMQHKRKKEHTGL